MPGSNHEPDRVAPGTSGGRPGGGHPPQRDAAWKRRLLSFPAFALAWLVWLGAAPLWLPLLAGVDLLRRRPPVALRSAALVAVYLSCELAGLAASAGLWLARSVGLLDAERWTHVHYRLEVWWASTLLDAVKRLFDLEIEVAGDAGLADGPYLLLLRHASAGDTLLAATLVTRPHGLRLRYVLKRELLWDPCLDVVGNRLPNVFVDRAAEDAASEVARVRELARGMGPRDGLLIYPEGTRFSESKRARVIDHYDRAGDAKMSELARSLARVLPPRPGGVLGALAGAPGADVVLCTHTGFEGAASLAQVWRGALLHKTVRVHFRRVPRASIPEDPADQVAWLQDTWRWIDAWVEKHRAP